MGGYRSESFKMLLLSQFLLCPRFRCYIDHHRLGKTRLSHSNLPSLPKRLQYTIASKYWPADTQQWCDSICHAFIVWKTDVFSHFDIAILAFDSSQLGSRHWPSLCVCPQLYIKLYYRNCNKDKKRLTATTVFMSDTPSSASETKHVHTGNSKYVNWQYSNSVKYHARNHKDRDHSFPVFLDAIEISNIMFMFISICLQVLIFS